MKRHVSLLLSILLINTPISACSSDDVPGIEKKSESNVDKKVLSNKEVTALIKELEKIDVGDALEDIHKILGQPSETRDFVPKERNIKEGVYRVYDVRYQDENGNISEGSINLLFSTKNKLLRFIISIGNFKRKEGLRK